MDQLRIGLLVRVALELGVELPLVEVVADDAVEDGREGDGGDDAVVAARARNIERIVRRVGDVDRFGGV